MARAHWHSQIELNLLSAGEMTYLINGRLVRLPERHVGVFWAATPHQVIDATGRVVAPGFIDLLARYPNDDEAGMYKVEHLLEGPQGATVQVDGRSIVMLTLYIPASF